MADVCLSESKFLTRSLRWICTDETMLSILVLFPEFFVFLPVKMAFCEFACALQWQLL